MNKSTYQPLGNIVRLLLMAGLVIALTGVPGQTARAYASPATVNLGKAVSFAILTKTGITTTGVTHVTGNLGVSPIAATGITSFALILDGSGMFSTSSLVTGRIYAADYRAPTPANLTTAVLNMQAAYTDAAGRSSPDATELYAGNLSGRTLAPGLYKWSTDVLIDPATNVTISGTATDVWIFQIAGNLTLNSGAQVLLSGGADANNIFWQVGGPAGVIINNAAHVEGTILAAKAITMKSGASLHGRALAQTAVTLIGNTIVIPVVTTFFVIYRTFLPIIHR
jgi:Ice-binding-like